MFLSSYSHTILQNRSTDSGTGPGGGGSGGGGGWGEERRLKEVNVYIYICNVMPDVSEGLANNFDVFDYQTHQSY